MPTFKCMVAFFAIALGSLLSNSLNAQEPIPMTSPAGEMSRSTPTPEEAKRQFRTWQAQYRAMQGMLREEQYKWMGYNPQRPLIYAGENFNVPYSYAAVPLYPVRSHIYYGGARFH